MRRMLLNRLFARLGEYQRRHCSRRQLQELSAHQLKDIGLTRADVEREIGKPFWRK